MLLVLGVLHALLTTAVGLAQTNTSIAVGLFLPEDAAEAASLRQGAELAVQEANKVSGPKVELVVRERTGQWGVESDETAQMVLDERVRGLIAPSRGLTSHLMLQVAGRTRIPVVSLSADQSVTGAGIPWMVRIVPDNGREARCLFAGTSDRIYCCSVVRWGVFVPAGRVGRQTLEDLKRAAEISDAKLQPVMEITASAGDFTNAVHQFLAIGADGVLLWVEPMLAGKIARALREAGFTGQIAGSSRLRCPAFLKTAGPAAEKTVVPGIALDQASEKVEAQLMKDAKISHPDVTLAASHDAARLLIEHLRQCGTQPAFEAFPRSAGMMGATGWLKFDRTGNRVADLELYACRNGRFEPITKRMSKP